MSDKEINDLKLAFREEKLEIFNKYTEPVSEFLLTSNLHGERSFTKHMNICFAVEAHKMTNYTATVEEIAELTGVHRSSVQRALANKDVIVDIFDEDTYSSVRKGIDNNSEHSQTKASEMAAMLYETIHNDKGQITGKKKK